MVKLSIDINKELYKRMYAAIQELSPGSSTYGKGNAFVTYAIESLLEMVEAGDKELVKALKQRLGART